MLQEPPLATRTTTTASEKRTGDVPPTCQFVWLLPLNRHLCHVWRKCRRVVDEPGHPEQKQCDDVGEHGLRRQLPYAIELRAGTRESNHPGEHERCIQYGRGPQCDEDPTRPRQAAKQPFRDRDAEIQRPAGLLPPSDTNAHSQVGD